MGFVFFLNAAGFGAGLAMDAFSVSMANGLNEPKMRPQKAAGIAAIFALFQTLMPLIGWFCVHTVATAFAAFSVAVPWIAFALLLWIGGKMIFEGVKGGNGKEEKPAVGLAALLLQGVATSIDALSVGFTIAEFSLVEALVEAGVIGVVTFAFCFAGVYLGKKFGTRLAGKASVLGGIILLIIGTEILLSSLLG